MGKAVAVEVNVCPPGRVTSSSSESEELPLRTMVVPMPLGYGIGKDTGEWWQEPGCHVSSNRLLSSCTG